jgi:hypothetical protein
MAKEYPNLGINEPKPPPTMGERLKAYRAKNKANRPKLDAELFAMFREMVKDIRQTFNEVMFGQPEHAAEPGTPLNPTQIMTTDDLRPGEFSRGKGSVGPSQQGPSQSVGPPEQQATTNSLDAYCAGYPAEQASYEASLRQYMTGAGSQPRGIER